jgi:hypothetical protein
MTTFNPRDWYWIVGGNGPHLEAGTSLIHPKHDRVYSSAKQAYVPVNDKAYQAWRTRLLAATPIIKEPATRIDTEENLSAVLKQHGLTLGKVKE